MSEKSDKIRALIKIVKDLDRWDVPNAKISEPPVLTKKEFNQELDRQAAKSITNRANWLNW